ncbi:MAG: helix-turn-helix domain-containing protein [Conexivisphaerales archaeon]
MIEEVQISANSIKDLDDAIAQLSGYSEIKLERVVKLDKPPLILARIAIDPSFACPMPSLVELAVSKKAHLTDEVIKNGQLQVGLELESTKDIPITEGIVRSQFSASKVGIVQRRGRRPSPKSHHILNVAFQRGYFDVPKKVSINQLAKELNMPVSTIDIDIRRALRRHLEKTLE